MTFEIRSLKYCLGCFFVLTGLAGVTTSFGQGMGNSPYSILGVGDLQGTSFSLNEGTGGAGVAAGYGFQINGLNPALAVRNRFTAFEFAGSALYKEIAAPGAVQKSVAANISHLALSFPVKSYWTTAISIKPYSYVDYNTSTRNIVAGTNYPSVYTFSGKGAINRVAWTNGFAIGKYLNVGVDLTYLFGNIQKSSELSLITGGKNDNTAGIRELLNLKNFTGRGGVALRLPVKKDKMYVNFGGTYSYGNFLFAKRTTFYELTQNSFPLSAPDTLLNNKKGSVQMPSQFRVGAGFELPFKLLISADYEYSDWDAFRPFGNPESKQVASTGRFYFGAEYIPKARSQRYLDLVSYRAGFNFGPTYFAPNGQQINETNISIGAGLPIGRDGASTLSIALSGGERGVVSGNSIRERYLRMTLGWAFGDRWFQKPRLD